MRTLGPVLLAVIAVLAGCTGLGAPLGGDGSAPTDEASTVAFPPGYTASGVNVSIAEPRHERRALASGSVTTVVRTDIVGDPDRDSLLSENISATETYRVDFRNGTLREQVRGVSRHDAYLPPDGEWKYVRTPRENPSVSPYSMRPVGTLTRYANPRIDHVGLFAFADALNLSYAGTRDGHIRFEADGFGPGVEDTRLAGIRRSEFRNVTGALVVDESGRVHRFAFEGDVYRPRDEYSYTYAISVELSAYGSTVPSAPPWLDAARDTYGD